jgi:hypothetical protein
MLLSEKKIFCSTEILTDDAWVKKREAGRSAAREVVGKERKELTRGRG